jgi:hypothetical protein
MIRLQLPSGEVRELTGDEARALERAIDHDLAHAQAGAAGSPVPINLSYAAKVEQLQQQRRMLARATIAGRAPLALGHQLACFLLPIGRQEDVIGDLDECFEKRWLRTLGPTGAKWCYVWQLLRISTALAPGAMLSAIGAVIWKLFRSG